MSRIKKILTIIWFGILVFILFLLFSGYTVTHEPKLLAAMLFYPVLFVSVYFIVLFIVLAFNRYLNTFKGFAESIKMYQLRGKEKEIVGSWAIVIKPPVTRFKIVNKFLNLVFERVKSVFQKAYEKKSFRNFWKWFTTPSLNKKTYITMYIIAFAIFALWCFYPQLIR